MCGCVLSAGHAATAGTEVAAHPWAAPRVNHHARQWIPRVPCRGPERGAGHCHGTGPWFREILPCVEVHSPQAVRTVSADGAAPLDRSPTAP